ncbi:MAG: polysaccharide deacetylase family protein [Solirubrobacterales bacterium]|nr:polysaccharide deacetylase family protein [Solirubrobacterales bacterium]
MRKLAALGLALALAGCGSTAKAPVHPRRIHHHAKPAHPGYVRNATPQPGWRRHTGPVPILVYHDLGNAPASEPYSGLYMPYPKFEAEMAWLHSAGYQAVTLDEVMKAWFHHGKLPAKPIVITFDNGYLPQITEAPKVLAKYGWPGVLNEITQGHLSNAELGSVLKLGWEVDSHSGVHSDLRYDTPAELHTEVASSRKFLQTQLHVPSNSFCYPSSKYNARVIAAVKAAGYTNATTEGHAYATRANPYLLPRFEQETGLSQLKADLATPH